MRRIIYSLISILTVASLALPLASAYGDQTAPKDQPSAGQPDTSKRTGFTDGQKTPPGTNVVAGEEAPRSGPQGGVERVIKKSKKRKHKTSAGVVPRGSAQGESQGSSQELHSYPEYP